MGELPQSLNPYHYKALPRHHRELGIFQKHPHTRHFALSPLLSICNKIQIESERPTGNARGPTRLRLPQLDHLIRFLKRLKILAVLGYLKANSQKLFTIEKNINCVLF